MLTKYCCVRWVYAWCALFWDRLYGVFMWSFQLGCGAMLNCHGVYGMSLYLWLCHICVACFLDEIFVILWSWEWEFRLFLAVSLFCLSLHFDIDIGIHRWFFYFDNLSVVILLFIIVTILFSPLSLRQFFFEVEKAHDSHQTFSNWKDIWSWCYCGEIQSSLNFNF